MKHHYFPSLVVKCKGLIKFVIKNILMFKSLLSRKHLNLISVDVIDYNDGLTFLFFIFYLIVYQ